MLKGDQVLNLENEAKDQRALLELNCISKYQELEGEFNQKMSTEMSRIDREFKIMEAQLREECARQEAELMSQFPR